MHFKKLLSLFLALLMLFSFTACSIDQETVELATDVALAFLEEDPEAAETTGTEETAITETPEALPDTATEEETVLAEASSYTTKEDVALYLHTYGHLPDNFMTKNEAKALGWSGGGLDDYAEGMCIGGDRFGNYEGLLPDADGRIWTECDIDTLHANSRGAKRIVFSNDGLIYYTEDHYESFTLLYGEE